MTNKRKSLKDLEDINVENQNRQLNKHLKSGLEKISKNKPISGFFSKQAALLLMNLIIFLIHYQINILHYLLI